MDKSAFLDNLREVWDSTEPAGDALEWDELEAAVDEVETVERPVSSSKPPERRKGLAGERFAVLNRFIDFTAGTCRRSELLVWLILFRDTKNGLAGTSQSDIAKRTRLGRRTVQLALNSLEAKGLAQCVYRGGLSRGISRYRVHAFPAGANA